MCKLDTGKSFACTSPWHLAQLTPGPHTFFVVPGDTLPVCWRSVCGALLIGSLVACPLLHLCRQLLMGEHCLPGRYSFPITGSKSFCALDDTSGTKAASGVDCGLPRDLGLVRQALDGSPFATKQVSFTVSPRFTLPQSELAIYLQIPTIRLQSVALLPSSLHANSSLLAHEFVVQINKTNSTFEPTFGSLAPSFDVVGALHFEIRVDRCAVAYGATYTVYRDLPIDTCKVAYMV